MFQVGLSCYLGLNSGQSVSIMSTTQGSIFPETFLARACFISVSQFPIRETLCQVSVFVFKIQIMLTLTAGNFNENLSMQALAKILQARASEHSSNFCEQFEQRPNFASTFKLDRTIRYPLQSESKTKGAKCKLPRLELNKGRGDESAES